MSHSTAERLAGYYRWHAVVYDWTRWAFLFGRAELVRTLAKRARPKRILEVGCGTGTNLARLARLFPEAEIVGLDLSSDMLAQARQKVAPFGPRISLVEGAYRDPISPTAPFDLIVFAYCLTMINPGFAEVLQVCRQDLAPTGTLAIVDFHDTRFTWFRRWMGVNHVRMDGQIPAELKDSGMHLELCAVRAAYGGWWHWLICLAKPSPSFARRVH